MYKPTGASSSICTALLLYQLSISIRLASPPAEELHIPKNNKPNMEVKS